METTKTLELLMPKWPVAARKAYLVMNTKNNLIAVSELADAGCGVYFHMTGVEIDYEGEVVTRGWREKNKSPMVALWLGSQDPQNSVYVVSGLTQE